MLIMIALTIAAVAHLGPAPDRVVRGGGPLRGRGARGAGILAILVALPLGKMNSGVVLGPVKATPLTGALLLLLVSGVIAAAFWLAGRLGFGPLAPPLPPDVAPRLLPASPAPHGWLRLGSGLGIPADLDGGLAPRAAVRRLRDLVPAVGGPRATG